jgi:hypothetical protein
MRPFLLFFILLCCNNLFSQSLPFNSNNIPADSIILKIAYGRVDKSKNTYSHKLKKEEVNYSPGQKITYKIVFKSPVVLQGQFFLLVVTEAPNSSLDEEQFGYRDILFFQQTTKGHLQLIKSIIAADEMPIGDEYLWNEGNDNNDESLFSIVDIGKNKKALISTFTTSGNQHIEDTKNIELLELGKLTFLCTIRYRYDNAAYVAQDDSVCVAEKSSSDFDIIKSDKEWFDIKVHFTAYGYKKGCAETFIKKKSVTLYSYKNGDYVDTKGQNIDETLQTN